ncbi:MAG: IS630 transposase-related protein [Acinetobacter sp.]
MSKAQILLDAEQHPDDYISERAERFGVSTHAVFNALHAAGISRKKRR